MWSLVDRHNLHDISNEYGIRMVNFAVFHNMFIRKDINKATWICLDNNPRNQINHVLISRRERSVLVAVRTYTGANVGSNHYLVIAHIFSKISNVN